MDIYNFGNASYRKDVRRASFFPGGPHLQGKKRCGPHVLQPYPVAPFHHGRAHSERSPPPEGTAATPPLPAVGGQANRAGHASRVCCCCRSPLRVAEGRVAPRGAEDLRLRAAGGRALASRGRRTSKHVAGVAAAPTISSVSFLHWPD
jgi:hypothetical protein